MLNVTIQIDQELHIIEASPSYEDLEGGRSAFSASWCRLTSVDVGPIEPASNGGFCLRGQRANRATITTAMLSPPLHIDK